MFSSNTSQVSQDAVFIEDVMSTFLYTGNGSTQTITNGIDLAGKGGLVWIKSRSTANTSHALIDSVRGIRQVLSSNELFEQQTTSTSEGVTALNSNGFSLGQTFTSGTPTNTSAQTYVSWTFRKQPKFFDVVTWTGDGIAGRVIPHNLGSVPGCVIGKRTSATSDWTVYHRSLNGGTNPDSYQVLLNSTAAQSGPGLFLLVGAPTSTNITLALAFNQIGVTYVAYLFAHNAGGFGLTGTDNVISCGSATSTGSGTVTVNLGYEPQWILIKGANSAGYNWNLFDNMRGVGATGVTPRELNANLSNAEGNGGGINITSTGFTLDGSYWGSVNLIYIAIRRGPMKVPTDGTSVFNVLGYTVANNSTWANATPNGMQSSDGSSLVSGGSAVDAVLVKARGYADDWAWTPRLTGFSTNSTVSASLASNSTASETAKAGGVRGNASASSTGLQVRPVYSGATSVSFPVYLLSRAPGFFDEVCYTGTGTPLILSHNLGVAPELIIYKSRSNTYSWIVQSSAYPSVTGDYQILNSDGAKSNISGLWNTPTATKFGVALNGNFSEANFSGGTYVAYLFATCAGVSKVGSYTGTGTTLQVNCGFTAGARFVLIKRTDSTGDWYVWDSARGIVAGNDSYLLLNSTAAEVTSTDYIDTYSAGFEISSTAPAAINASGGTFLFFAVA